MTDEGGVNVRRDDSVRIAEGDGRVCVVVGVEKSVSDGNA